MLLLSEHAEETALRLPGAVILARLAVVRVAIAAGERAAARSPRGLTLDHLDVHTGKLELLDLGIGEVHHVEDDGEKVLILTASVRHVP